MQDRINFHNVELTSTPSAPLQDVVQKDESKQVMPATLNMQPQDSPPSSTPSAPRQDVVLKDESKQVVPITLNMQPQGSPPSYLEATTGEILLSLRRLEEAERQRQFEKDHPTLSEAGNKISPLRKFYDEASLIFNVFIGGRILDKAIHHEIDTEFFTLMPIYIIPQVLRSAYFSARDAEIVYTSADKQLSEVLEQKNVISKRKYNELNHSYTAYLEELTNAATVGLAITGAVFIPKPGQFDTGLIYLGAATLSQIFASLFNNKLKLTMAEEILERPIDRGKGWSDAAVRSLWTGLPLLLISGGASFYSQSQIAQNPTDHPIASDIGYVSFFVFMASALIVSLGILRIRGSDYIELAVNQENMGKGQERLTSYFLNRWQSRSDVDGFISAGLLTSLMGVTASAIDNTIGSSYMAVAAATLQGYFSAELQANLVARNKVREIQFWKKSPGRIEHAMESGDLKADAKTAPNKTPEVEEDDKKGLRNSLCTRMFRWLSTHGPFYTPETKTEQKMSVRR